MSEQGPRLVGGGVAGAAGTHFEDLVAAWIAVRILGEQDVAPPWGLPATCVLSWLQCQGTSHVEDIEVGASDGTHVYLQAKRSIDLGRKHTSEFASVIQQFVKQFIVHSRASILADAPAHPASGPKAIFVLATSTRSSAPVRIHLPAAMGKACDQHLRELPLDRAPANREESKALDTVLAHIRSSWKKERGDAPTDGDVCALLNCIVVQVLDLETGQRDALDSQDALRRLLADPSRCAAALAELQKLCGSLADGRLTTNRRELVTALEKTGIFLRTVRSFQNDVQRLAEISRKTLDRLGRGCRLKTRNGEIGVPRACMGSLRAAAEGGSLLVVGVPGAGKSGVLHDLVIQLQGKGQDVVLLSADRVGRATRGELGLDHDPDEVLQEWPGPNPALLVIDALDAVRDANPGAALRGFLEDVLAKPGRWRVIAAVREFDLRNSPALQELFPGEPAGEFRPRELANVRHLSVAGFTEEEVSGVCAFSPDLDGLWSSASPELRALLRNPFNLNLAAQILGAGVDTASFSTVRTQIELLNKYWSERVLRPLEGRDAREAVVRRLCEVMCRRRKLQVPRKEAGEPPSGDALIELLRDHVVVETDPDGATLEFSHLLLFDYAASRLLREFQQEGKMVERLVQDPGLILFLPPSFMLFYEHLWYQPEDRGRFWATVLSLAHSESVSALAKSIGPRVAAELARVIEDLSPICRAISSTDPKARASAVQSLHYLIVALDALNLDTAGADAGPWCALLDRLALELRPDCAYPLARLLEQVIKCAEGFTHQQLADAGRAGRQLLDLAWGATSRNEYWIRCALQAVCRTFASDPVASARALRRAIETAHLSQRGYMDLPTVAREIPHLVRAGGGEVVKEIYVAAHSYDEGSSDSIQMGSGQILGLLSTRRQDYEMGRYTLSENFGAFLQHAPDAAVATLDSVVEIHIVQEKIREMESSPGEFQFEGVAAIIHADESRIWDSTDTPELGSASELLTAFEKALVQTASAPAGSEDLDAVLRSIARHGHSAAVWRRLLRAGLSEPQGLGQRLVSLAAARAILACADTTWQAGDLLKAHFGGLPAPERARIEGVVISLGESAPADREEIGATRRDRLLGCLPAQHLVTPEAQNLRARLEAGGRLPSNQSPYVIHDCDRVESPNDRFLDLGGREGSQGDRRLFQQIEKVEELRKRFERTAPVVTEAGEMLANLQALHTELQALGGEPASASVQDHGWSELAAGCAEVARAKWLTDAPRLRDFLREVLLVSSTHAQPLSDPDQNAGFDEHPSWAPAARIEAARGLMIVLATTGAADPAVAEAVDLLSHDPAPAVRYQIAQLLAALGREAPELLWSIAQRILREDPSTLVRGAAVASLQHLAREHTQRVVSLLMPILDEVAHGPGVDRLREGCLLVLCVTYLSRDDKQSYAALQQFATRNRGTGKDVQHLVGSLSDALRLGPVEKPDAALDLARSRAFGMLATILDVWAAEWTRLETACINAMEEASEQVRTDFKAAVAVLAGIAGRLHYLSGASREKKKLRAGQSPSEPTSEDERFLREARGLFDRLADIGVPAIAHHVLEVTMAFAPVDSRSAFLRMGRVVRAGERYGYHREGMAADLVVDSVERYLAEYRALLSGDPECEIVLREMLDVFVRVGWPRANRLVYRLDEIYR